MNVRLFCLLCDVHVAASAKSLSLVQRSPAGFVCVSVCDLETSTIERPGPQLDCFATERNKGQAFIFKNEAHVTCNKFKFWIKGQSNIDEGTAKRTVVTLQATKQS
jgi:hypothetical protein